MERFMFYVRLVPFVALGWFFVNQVGSDKLTTLAMTAARSALNLI